jgi:hypothetical protein
LTEFHFHKFSFFFNFVLYNIEKHPYPKVNVPNFYSQQIT